MFDQLIGMLLLGLGINKSFYTPNPNVKGDETVATQESRLKPLRPVRNVYRLNPQNFEDSEGSGQGGTTASRAGSKKPKFNARAFGMGVLKMQEDFAGEIEASREAAKKEFEGHKQEFKQELSRIKDTRKQIVVDKLNTNCQEVNTKRTQKMTEMLTKLSTILTNVSNRSATLSATGKDTSILDSAVTTAQTAIADAQSAVAAQAGSPCSITITTETNLKTDVGKVISGMQQNLKGAYDKVVAARKAVTDAVKDLAKLTGESLDPAITPKVTTVSATTQ